MPSSSLQAPPFDAPFLAHYLRQTPAAQMTSSAVACLAALDHLTEHAPEVAASIVQELKDQRSYAKLIASENYSSLAVQLAMGNWLTDKYSEGYPGHRFYAGCDNIDAIEARAVSLLKQLFGSDHAYVQPHSGADANLVAFWAILTYRVQSKELERLGKKTLDELSPEELESIRQKMLNQKVMGLSLSSGGHLTHGYKHNISSKMMRAVSYEVDPQTERLDYTALASQVQKERPDILLAGYSSYPRNLNFAKMREIADSVGAVLMVDMAHFAGLVAGKVLTGEQDPVPYAHIITSTTHKTLRGPRGGMILCTKEFSEVVDKGCPLVLGGPLPHVMAAKAIAFQEALQEDFRCYAKQIVLNSQALADALQRQGMQLFSGGTDNHLLVMKVSPLGLTGRHAEKALRQAHLTVNRNVIPNDPNGPWYTSGVRLGTPALTTLGMKEAEMKRLAPLLVDVLKHTTPNTNASTGKSSLGEATVDPAVLTKVQEQIADLLSGFPLYPEITLP